MRRFIKPLYSLLALGLIFGLFACGKNEPQPPGPGKTAEKTPESKPSRRIVFIFKSAGQYSEACRKGADQANSELSAQGVKVEYFAPEKAEVGKQIQYMDQLIAQKADAIVISPNDEEAIVPIIKKAMDNGVKVFTWDSDAPASQRIFYVAAADDVQIGVDIAEALAKDLGGRGKVAVMSGGRTAANLNLHVQGVVKGLKKYPGITILQPYVYNDEDVAKATGLAVAAFQKDRDIAGFACVNSQGPPGVGEAVTKLGKIGQVKVWGLSLPSQTRQYLKSGALSGIKLWDPGKLTYLTAKLVADYLDGKQPQDGAEYPGIGKISYKDSKVIMPGVTFTKDNVDQFDF
jgi:ABC-type sugar transport system substrate-binding protein